MPIPVPNLDDRTFADLVAECRTHIAKSCPEWTDLSPSDPGMVVLELFSHLTEVMIYRLNQLPGKAYIEFLRLLGVQLLPPSAAQVELVFSLEAAKTTKVEIPRGTRVTTLRREGETPIFSTTEAAVIPAGATEIRVPAMHGDLIEGELIGHGTGAPGLRLSVRKAPVLLGGDFFLAVESSGPVADRASAREFDARTFVIWKEVPDFCASTETDRHFLADRASGTVHFAPALLRQDETGSAATRPEALASVPETGRQIRVWYRTGGGVSGNVGPGRLSVLKDPIPGVSVTNSNAAAGGRDAETLENALLRGPHEFRSLERAVTARDYELLALRHGSVARTRAFTKAEYWKYASPGTVAVVLVPDLPTEEMPGKRVAIETLRTHQSPAVLADVSATLEERSPLGTSCEVSFVRYKTVCVRARVVIHPEENPDTLRPRVMERLFRSISPMPPSSTRPGGWPFGKPLRASDIYDMILAEPGVSYVSQVRFLVDAAPSESVKSLTADPFHPGHWFAAAAASLYRSVNDAAGWEALATFSSEALEIVRPHASRAGKLAVISKTSGTEMKYRIRISSNGGDTWDRQDLSLALQVNDAAWLIRDGADILLLATEKGLYEIAATPGSTPIQVVVSTTDQALGFEAVTALISPQGESCVAVAATAKKGVFFSPASAKANSFSPFGLEQNIRVLEVEVDGPRRFLWAGTWATGDEPGAGCFRRELFTAEDKWTQFSKGWEAGSCWSISFNAKGIHAATHRGGVLTLSATDGSKSWEAPDVNCGLPNRDKPRFEPVECLAAGPWPNSDALLSAGPRGVFRKAVSGRWLTVSAREFNDEVTLPPFWLFCSGEHDITLTHDHETSRH